MFKTPTLLIEDNDELRFKLEGILNKSGFRVVSADNVNEGFEKNGSRKLKLVIVGVEDDWESSVSMLRLNNSTKHAAVFALVDDIRHKVDLVKSLGVDDYILKPVSEQLFGRLVKEKFMKYKNSQKKNRKTGGNSVLVIDDEDDIRHVIALNLKLSGFEVNVASDGLSGLQLARKLRPDLILLDVMMPGMDGLEVLNIWKFDERIKDIPVFMLTAKTTMDDVEKAFSRGASDYLTKPFEGKDLGDNIRNKLKRIHSQKGK